MSKFLGLALLFCALLACADESIDMGGVKIVVPTPSGMRPAFGERTGESTMRLEGGMYLMGSDSPHTKQLLLYLPQASIAESINAGEFRVPTRYFVVTANDKLIGVPVTSDDFVKLKKAYQDEIVEVKNKLEKELPGVGAKLARHPPENIVLQRSLEVLSLVVLGDPEVDQRAVTFSGVSRGGFPSDATPSDWSTFTQTHMVVKKRLICFQTYGSRNDLEWTRTASKQWVQEILKANR